jgi:hypothetical protein
MALADLRGRRIPLGGIPLGTSLQQSQGRKGHFLRTEKILDILPAWAIEKWIFQKEMPKTDFDKI